MLRTLVFSLLLTAFAAHISVGQTLSEEKNNNTAACSAANYGLLGSSYCADSFPGSQWPYPGWEDRASSLVLTQPHDPVVTGDWNISKGRGTNENPPLATDVHSLLYGGAVNNVTTKVVMEVQSWFCNPSTWSNCENDGTFSPSGDGQTFQLWESHDNVQYTALATEYDGRENGRHVGPRRGYSRYGLERRPEQLSSRWSYPVSLKLIF